MHPMDAQRYDLSKRSSPVYEENGVSDATATLSEIPPVFHHASLVEAPRSPLLPIARTTFKHSQQCDALAVPLPLSPVLSTFNGFMETLSISDALNDDSLMSFPVSSDEDFKSSRLPEIPLPSLVAPSPRVPDTSRRPMRPLFHQNDSSENFFSRPGISSPPLSPQSRPTSPRFWKSACSSPITWPARPLSPSYYRFNNLPSDRWDSMSCPTSPVLRPSKPPPTPASPTSCHAMFSTVSHRLRALSSTSSMAPWKSPAPSHPTSPTSRPTSPIRQVFNIDNWIQERDPTEGIDVIEIMVTKEISIRIEESV